MTKDRFYPPLDEKPLMTISLIYENDPDYFNDRNCPYSQQLIDLFRGRSKFHDFDSHGSKDLPSSDDIVSQINKLAKQLENYWSEIKGGEASPQDKNTYFRIAAGLTEKMLSMRERASNVKQFEVFTATVLDILDTEMDVDRRNKVMDRLKTILGTPLTEEVKEGIQLDTTQETGKNKNENNAEHSLSDSGLTL